MFGKLDINLLVLLESPKCQGMRTIVGGREKVDKHQLKWNQKSQLGQIAKEKNGK